MKVKDILAITGGRLLSGRPGDDVDPARISTDSRKIGKGEFFLALSGPNFCGSDFAEDAFRKGASGAIVERAIKSGCAGKTVIQVKDSTAALQAIASSNRALSKAPVICVTGSNGKTTVKDMTASLLSSKYRVLKNEGTKNNHIGVPQTLLKLAPFHEVCVLELGTNHRGEIRSLAGMARPDIAVITNIGPSHLEFLDDLEGVYEEKRQLVEALGGKGFAVINGDDAFLSGMSGPRVVKYGFGPSNDVQGRMLSADGRTLEFVVNEKHRFRLNMLGEHNVYNALAAIAAAFVLGAGSREARHALAAYRPTHMRLDPIKIKGLNIIDDSYNSNPLSMQAALKAVKEYPASSRWVVSGDMLELGKDARRFHEMVGAEVADSAVQGLLTFGEFSRHTLSGAMRRGMGKSSLWHCSSNDEIAGILKKVAAAGDVVLVKGSRGMEMEKVIEKLKV